jgi:hypothetical protein
VHACTTSFTSWQDERWTQFRSDGATPSMSHSWSGGKFQELVRRSARRGAGRQGHAVQGPSFRPIYYLLPIHSFLNSLDGVRYHPR